MSLRNGKGRTNEKEVDEEDRISSLPDCLLIHILSFVGDTKQVVRTSLLSKRWEFLWTGLSEVDLHMKSLDNSKRRRFLDWVRRMFATCKNLTKFHLHFSDYPYCISYNVNNLIYMAIQNKVKDIGLYGTGYDLPQLLYSYSPLTNLTLSNCIIAPKGIALGSLKSLSLQNVELFDSVMEKLLGGCPVLEVLKLTRCYGTDYLNISSPNLTTLVLKDYNSTYGEVLPNVSAPYLLDLSILNVSDTMHIRLSNVSSVVQANLDSANGDAKDEMLHHLESLRFVKKLELGRNCFAMVSALENAGSKLPLFTQLRCLTLVVRRHEISIPGILGLLRSSPKLETLHIRCWNGDYCYEEMISDLVNYKIVASHLKTVEITGFSEQDLAAEYMLTLVEILLKSAEVLEKMVIRVKYPSSGTSIDSIEIAKRLPTFIRASLKATVVFC